MIAIGAKPKHIVFIPEAYIENRYIGKLQGWYIENSSVFNIIDYSDKSSSFIGEIFPCKPNCQKQDWLCGWWNEDQLHFEYNGVQLLVEKYGLISSIFSRHEGILESSFLQKKCAIISGCGSVGSLVALELARSGVGNFVLIDNDIIQYHNLCRHQCDITDVGKYKTDALSDRIKRIQPNAQVESIVSVLEQVPKNIFDAYCRKDNSILIGCADNREADVYANMIAATYGIPFISIGFWERAFAGEIFYYVPGKNMPCYECAIGSSPLSGRVESNHRFYTTQSDLEKVSFEPGISIDIDFVTIVGIKLALDILNQGNDKFTQRLLPTFEQFTLVCNTNNPRIGGEMAEIFAYPLQVTTSLKVGFSPDCNGKCKYEGK